jgi:hypothetical protein
LEDVRGLLEELGDGNVLVERYRGRSAYSFAVQAAEQAIRLEYELFGIDDLELLGSEAAGGALLVRFRDPAGAVHTVEVAEERGEEAVYLTCGAVTPQHARRYAATAHRVKSP